MNADKYFDMGMQFMTYGQCESAQYYFKKCIDMYSLQTHKAMCYNALGMAFERNDQTKDAEDAYKQAIKLDSTHKLFYVNLFNLHKFQRKSKEALQVFQDHIYTGSSSQDVETLAELFTSVANYEKAYDLYADLIKQFPHHIDYYWKIALSCNSMGKNKEAISWASRGLQIEPDHHHCSIALGIAQMFSKQLMEAQNTFANLRVDIYSKKWYTAYLAFLNKNYTEGWKNYEIRNEGMWAVKPLRNKPMWDGTPMPDKTILVAAEQGLGDNIMAARWLHIMQKHFKKVIYWCNPRIYDLMLHLKHPTHIIQSATDATDFDVWLPIMSIPQRLNLTDHDMRLDDPYFVVDADKINTTTKKKIGICWAGSNNHQFNRYRTIFEKDYDKLRALIQANSNFEWYSLIKDEYQDDHIKLGIENPVKKLTNVYETAKFIKTLDLVISIDTLQAHLAGAMQVPTIIMLPWFPEWRWGLEGDKTIWYSSAKLIRQDKPFDWTGVLNQINKYLKTL